MRLWDEANVCGLQAIRANTVVSHYNHVYNKKYTSVQFWNYFMCTFQQTNPAQSDIATSKWLECVQGPSISGGS